MIARGAITNPFIFKQINELRATGTYSLPTIADRVELCVRHLRHSCEVRGEQRGVFAFRKHYAGYLRELHGGARVRSELMQITELERCVERLQLFGSVSVSIGF
jgi:tRNA-dihydrouridine synthase B